MAAASLVASAVAPRARRGPDFPPRQRGRPVARARPRAPRAIHHRRGCVPSPPPPAAPPPKALSNIRLARARAAPRSPPDPARPVILPPIAVAAAAAEALEEVQLPSSSRTAACGTASPSAPPARCRRGLFSTRPSPATRRFGRIPPTGQFVLFTCPEIGNVGINLEDMESTKAHMGGMLVRHLSLNVSNYRSAMSFLSTSSSRASSKHQRHRHPRHHPTPPRHPAASTASSPPTTPRRTMSW